MTNETPENIRGLFSLELCGSKRELKCTFEVIEQLERAIFKRPLVKVLTDAVNGDIYFSDVVDTILCGLHANKDTRLKRQEIGEYVHSKGLPNFLEFYTRYLTYALTGSDQVDVEETETGLDKKK